MPARKPKRVTRSAGKVGRADAVPKGRKKTVRKATIPTPKESKGEARLRLDIRALKLPTPEQEYRFHPVRQWRFDFAWPDLMLAVEVEGGVYTKGRHTRGKGFEDDCDKYNEAARLGWKLLRFSTQRVMKGEAARVIETTIREALCQHQ